MADDLFRIASLSSKNSFESSSRLNPAKQAIRVFDDTASKSRIASSSSAKGYLPVFDLVPRYDDDIFEGVPGTKSATAGTVYDDLFGDVEVVKSTAAPHLVGRPSSVADSTVRRANPTDVSSSVSRDGLSESNSFQSSRSRWGRPNTQYARWSQQPSLAGSNDFLRKPAKMDCPDDLFVDPVSPGNHQARESTILDSLDPFNMKYHTGGRNVPVVSIVSEETSRAKENTASIGSCQSTTMSMSSHSKPSHNSYVRKLENGNLTSSETPSKIGALEVRTVRQHIHRNGPTASAFSTPVTPSTWKKSQYSANIDSRYSNSPVKSNEFLQGKLTPSIQFNVEHISESIRHIEPRGFEEVWLTIDDVRLVTQPTSAPPPSRSPPTFGLNKKEMTQRRKSNQSKGFASKLLEGEERFPNAKVGSDSTLGHQAAKTPVSGFPLFQEKGIKLSKAQLESTNYGFVVRPEEQRVASVATASELDMKEAIKRAEALLKLGKDLEEKELSAKAAKEAEKEEKENVAADAQRVGRKEPNHTDARESEVDQQGSWRHRDHERTKNRLVFESANQEACEKAGVKAPSETRERAEKAAVQRITAEVRERAAAEAREKVAAKIKTVTEARLKAAAGARERAAAEPRERAAMEARERAVAEARKKSAAEARERVAAEAREKAAAEARKQEAAEAREKAAEEAREKERAAADARERERAAAEAREKVVAEARERERAAAEARERAATEASEKEAIEAREKAARELMEKLAAEAREKAAAEGKEKLVAEENARMAAEARERIAAEARERAAAQARAISERVAVQKAIDEVRERAAEKAKAEARQRDAEKAMAEAHTRAESAQKLRPVTLDPMNASHPSKIFQKEEDRSSACGSSAVKTSPTIIPDDWMASFVASPTTEVQEMRGELSDRRQVSSERHQRTEERMAKALAEKNQRDFEVLQQEAEKHRAAEVLDVEIRRWAVGKEGNLRALLSTLHYVLWPGCGWQPVSVSDLVTAAAVKKIYRKATLCIHPDKVQQKGSSVQQKYIAEKVFDLLKEAWNKFSSGELF